MLATVREGTGTERTCLEVIAAADGADAVLRARVSGFLETL